MYVTLSTWWNRIWDWWILVELGAAASTLYWDAASDLSGNFSQQVGAWTITQAISNDLSDIDEKNARTAEQNVKLNKLESRIQIVRTDPKDSLFPLDKFGQKR